MASGATNDASKIPAPREIAQDSIGPSNEPTEQITISRAIKNEALSHIYTNLRDEYYFVRVAVTN